MKHTVIALPYINIYLSNAIEPGSIGSLLAAPVMMDTITSAATGRKTNLYFSLHQAEFTPKDYDEAFMVPDLALQIAKTIRDFDMMEDGTGAILQNLTKAEREQAEHMVEELPSWVTSAEEDPAFYLWVAIHGQYLARTLLNLAVDASKPTRDAYAILDINNPQHGDRIGRAFMPAPGGVLVSAELYLGEIPDVLENPPKNMPATVKAMRKGLQALRQRTQPTYQHVEIVERTHRFSEHSSATRYLTAVFEFPFEDMASWFAEGVLTEAVNEAITLSMAGARMLLDPVSINPDPSVEEVTISSNLAQAARKVDEIFSNSETANQLVVLVLGRAHQGKTHISATIEQQLKTCGFSNVTVMDQEDSDEVRLQMANSVAAGREMDLLNNQPITLLEVNMPRSASTDYRFE